MLNNIVNRTCMEHTQRDRKSIRTGLLRKTCLLLLFINGLLTVPVYAQEIRVNLSSSKPIISFFMKNDKLMWSNRFR